MNYEKFFPILYKNYEDILNNKFLFFIDFIPKKTNVYDISPINKKRNKPIYTSYINSINNSSLLTSSAINKAILNTNKFNNNVINPTVYNTSVLNAIGLLNKKTNSLISTNYTYPIKNPSLLANNAINKAYSNTTKFNNIIGKINLYNTYNYSVTDKILKSLNYNKPSYFSTIKNFNYKIPSSVFYTNFNKTIDINKLIVPKNHFDLLGRVGFKENFTATRIRGHSTYLKRKDSDEYTDINSISDAYALYDENLGFSEKELFEFIRYIQNNPMLILNHKIGKKIYDEIQSFNIGLFETAEELTLYKTRTKKDKFPFSYEQMSITPYDISRGGRFDSYGQSLLYTANQKEISLLEVYDEHSKYYHVQQYLYNNNLKLADFTKIDSHLLDILLRPKTSNNYQEYILPRFIAECIKFGGYGGLVIRSSKSLKHRNDLNFNLFDHATNELKRGEYEVLSKKEVDFLIHNYK
ncbi:RES family NAD+ phosphorylase [Staphylococcus saprophyticus]|uniref:RES family NAD+ phosphorylase n=1 Tax=Staphylococcus saprophyticus TaxID=29385 RepID=UPI0008539B04|nr:RES family NAD+ phosphorylase [Staphylococcus saprophyticus]MDW4112010.1 RES family NAD+ phosphorylase [Staphylococcus saprophyticus]MDW4488231.1 RES family NAD+ phosphorylase [Staphylococcus saprophyticus]OEK12925.1 hypothetical protein ASS79_01065 [Staphylococcus saprophyticus]QKV12485.1 RES family NAD+ phosphorylase [Staphylococcus saprophyticus]